MVYGKPDLREFRTYNNEQEAGSTGLFILQSLLTRFVRFSFRLYFGPIELNSLVSDHRRLTGDDSDKKFTSPYYS